MANARRLRRAVLLSAVPAALGLVVSLLLAAAPEWRAVLTALCDVLSDRGRVHAWLASWGRAAPLVLLGLQVGQVLLAPVPGDVFCWLGGYLFGAFGGFWLSSIGMAIGSLVIFGLGRWWGEPLARRLLGAAAYEKYEALLRGRGLLWIFFFFLLPGFPKDTLCLVLGATRLPVRVFLLLSTLGRIPATAAFSLQGAAVFSRDWAMLAAVSALILALGAAALLAREPLGRWARKRDRRGLLGGPRA